MSNATTTKNLIVGCAFNYANSDILPFLNSLQACGYTDDLILLTNDKSRINLGEYAYKGTTINVDRDFKNIKTTAPAGNISQEPQPGEPYEQRLMARTLQKLEKEKSLSKTMVAFFYQSYFLMTSRYFLYYYYLRQTDYTHIFLTDVNDVFFQKNPFEQTYENGVTAFAEQDGISIAQEATNRFWIQQTFGDEVLQNMGDEIVYCAGTMLFANSIQQFLKDFLTIVIQQKVSNWIQGVDQGVFNYMISYLKLPYFYGRQNGDGVLTVANVPEERIALTEKGIALEGSNVLPDVVHQYTRFEQQKNYVVEKFK